MIGKCLGGLKVVLLTPPKATSSACSTVPDGNANSWLEQQGNAL